MIDLFGGDQHDPAKFVASTPAAGQPAQGARGQYDLLLCEKLDPGFGRSGAVNDWRHSGHDHVPFASRAQLALQSGQICVTVRPDASAMAWRTRVELERPLATSDTAVREMPRFRAIWA